MKYLSNDVDRRTAEVAPHWGAWIEILDLYNCWGASVVAPHWGAWIEILPK